MDAKPHILINGLSIGSGGGYTVGRELFRHIAMARPGWRVTLALTADNPLHEEMRAEPGLPANAALTWAPAETAARVARARYERRGLTGWARENAVSAVVQLNGMIVPGMPAPTLSHCQDPWPYRPEAWGRFRDRLVAFVKRRANARAFRHAAVVGFTSRYLMDLMTGRLGVRPRRAKVFYNGLPPEWLARLERPLPDWSGRPMEIATVSNVGQYKRHDLVIRALPELLKRPGLSNLIYRIAGHGEPGYVDHLRQMARSLGVGEHVVFEGRVSDARVVEILLAARAFVLMSVCESFGIPAIEAMSLGTPVVTANCCAMPEVCGPAAVLSPVDDLKALVNNVARVVQDPAAAEALRAQGVEQAKRFRWDQTGAQMAESLDEMISDPPK